MSEQRNNMNNLEALRQACQESDIATVVDLFKATRTVPDYEGQATDSLDTWLTLAEGQYTYLTFFERLYSKVQGVIDNLPHLSEGEGEQAVAFSESVLDCMSYTRRSFEGVQKELSEESAFESTRIGGLLQSPDQAKQEFAVKCIACGTDLRTLNELKSAVSDTNTTVTELLWAISNNTEKIANSTDLNYSEREELIAMINDDFARISEELLIAIDGLQPPIKITEPESY